MTRSVRAKHDSSRLPLVVAFTVILTLVFVFPVGRVVLMGIRAVAPTGGPPMSAFWFMTAMGFTVVFSVAVSGIMASMLFRCAVRLDGEQESRSPNLHDECGGCGYSLEGLTSDRCPECGAELPLRS